MWCIPKIDDLFIARMMNILEIYEREYDPLEPVLCFDEKSKQLLEETRKSIPPKPGKIQRFDYEYKRKGNSNIFVTTEPKGNFRTVKVTKRRTKQDFAKEINRIINLKRYREALKIHIVLDNLNTHFEKSIYETFPKEKADEITNKVCFHYTPKHASWLNMAEIEINVLSGQCLDRKISTEKELRKHVNKWKNDRNRKKKGIKWQFTRKKAGVKFKLHNY